MHHNISKTWLEQLGRQHKRRGQLRRCVLGLLLMLL
jgi:hypothetical protein